MADTTTDYASAAKVDALQMAQCDIRERVSKLEVQNARTWEEVEEQEKKLFGNVHPLTERVAKLEEWDRGHTAAHKTLDEEIKEIELEVKSLCTVKANVAELRKETDKIWSQIKDIDCIQRDVNRLVADVEHLKKQACVYDCDHRDLLALTAKVDCMAKDVASLNCTARDFLQLQVLVNKQGDEIDSIDDRLCKLEGRVDCFEPKIARAQIDNLMGRVNCLDRTLANMCTVAEDWALRPLEDAIAALALADGTSGAPQAGPVASASFQLLQSQMQKSFQPFRSAVTGGFGCGGGGCGGFGQVAGFR